MTTYQFIQIIMFLLNIEIVDTFEEIDFVTFHTAIIAITLPLLIFVFEFIETESEKQTVAEYHITRDAYFQHFIPYTIIGLQIVVLFLSLWGVMLISLVLLIVHIIVVGIWVWLRLRQWHINGNVSDNTKKQALTNYQKQWESYFHEITNLKQVIEEYNTRYPNLEIDLQLVVDKNHQNNQNTQKTLNTSKVQDNISDLYQDISWYLRDTEPQKHIKIILHVDIISSNFNLFILSPSTVKQRDEIQKIVEKHIRQNKPQSSLLPIQETIQKYVDYVIELTKAIYATDVELEQACQEQERYKEKFFPNDSQMPDNINQWITFLFFQHLTEKRYLTISNAKYQIILRSLQSTPSWDYQRRFEIIYQLFQRYDGSFTYKDLVHRLRRVIEHSQGVYQVVHVSSTYSTNEYIQNIAKDMGLIFLDVYKRGRLSDEFLKVLSKFFLSTSGSLYQSIENDDPETKRQVIGIALHIYGRLDYEQQDTETLYQAHRSFNLLQSEEISLLDILQGLTYTRKLIDTLSWWINPHPSVDMDTLNINADMQARRVSDEPVPYLLSQLGTIITDEALNQLRVDLKEVSYETLRDIRGLMNMNNKSTHKKDKLQNLQEYIDQIFQEKQKEVVENSPLDSDKITEFTESLRDAFQTSFRDTYSSLGNTIQIEKGEDWTNDDDTNQARGFYQKLPKDSFVLHHSSVEFFAQDYGRERGEQVRKYFENYSDIPPEHTKEASWNTLEQRISEITKEMQDPFIFIEIDIPYMMFRKNLNIPNNIPWMRANIPERTLYIIDKAKTRITYHNYTPKENADNTIDLPLGDTHKVMTGEFSLTEDPDDPSSVLFRIFTWIDVTTEIRAIYITEEV